MRGRVALGVVALLSIVVPVVGVAAGQAAASVPAPDRYVPVSPVRVMDTRGLPTVDDDGPVGKLVADSVVNLRIAGRAGVPAAGISSVVLTVTVTEPERAGHLTAWATGEPRPVASSLNFVEGETSPNLVTVPLSSSGDVSLQVAGGSAHVVVDLNGWVPAGTDVRPVSPARLLDTRSGQPTIDGGGFRGAFTGACRDLVVAGRGGVPGSGVEAVMLNLTVTEPAVAGHLTVWPAGQARPIASNLNFTAGLTRANAVIVALGVGGAVSLCANTGPVHVIVDVNGWVPSDANLVPLSPARVMDTRDGQPTIDGAGPRGVVRGGSVTELQVGGRGGVPPSGVGAVVLNLTVTDPSGPGYVTAWPSGHARPLASSLNFVAGETRPNLVVVPVGAGGRVSLFVPTDRVHFVADVLGWMPDFDPLSIGPDTVAVNSDDVQRVTSVAADGSVTVRFRDPGAVAGQRVVVIAPGSDFPSGFIGLLPEVMPQSTDVPLRRGSIFDALPQARLTSSRSGAMVTLSDGLEVLSVSLVPSMGPNWPVVADWSCAGKPDAKVVVAVRGNVDDVEMAADVERPASAWASISSSPNLGVTVTIDADSAGECRIEPDSKEVRSAPLDTCVPLWVGCLPVQIDDVLTAAAEGTIMIPEATNDWVSYPLAGDSELRFGRNAGRDVTVTPFWRSGSPVTTDATLTAGVTGSFKVTLVHRIGHLDKVQGITSMASTVWLIDHNGPGGREFRADMQTEVATSGDFSVGAGSTERRWSQPTERRMWPEAPVLVAGDLAAMPIGQLFAGTPLNVPASTGVRFRASYDGHAGDLVTFSSVSGQLRVTAPNGAMLGEAGPQDSPSPRSPAVTARLPVTGRYFVTLVGSGGPVWGGQQRLWARVASDPVPLAADGTLTLAGTDPTRAVETLVTPSADGPIRITLSPGGCEAAFAVVDDAGTVFEQGVLSPFRWDPTRFAPEGRAGRPIRLRFAFADDGSGSFAACSANPPLGVGGAATGRDLRRVADHRAGRADGHVPPLGVFRSGRRCHPG